jgi:DNA-binding transcriptional MerR regulator
MFHKKILMQLKNLELSLEKVKQMLQDKMTEEQNLNESKFWCRSLFLHVVLILS